MVGKVRITEDTIFEAILKINPNEERENWEIYHITQQYSEKRSRRRWFVFCKQCNKKFEWKISTIESHIRSKHREETPQPPRKRERQNDNSFEIQVEETKRLKDLLYKKFKQDEAQSIADYSFKPFTDKMVNTIAEQIKKENE